MISRRSFLAAAVGAVAGGPCLTGVRSGPELSFGLVTDVQYADADAVGSRFYRQSPAKLAEAVEHFNGLKLEFVFNLGDLIDRDWTAYPAALRPLTGSRHRFHHLLGNHDFAVADEFKPRVPRRLGLKRRHYAIHRGAWCLVALDTTDVSPYAQPANSAETVAATAELRRLTAAGAVNAHEWNGAVGADQLRWFEATCRDAAQRGRKVVVLSHHPVFPVAAPTAWNAAQLLAVVERHRNVVAWLNGHNHAGAFGVHAGVPFVTLQGMVETVNRNAFAVAYLHPDRLELVGHGREPSRELGFRSV